MGNIETQVTDWATEAADGFLNRQIPLNDTIKKIASREKLNREKVARVVETANQSVFLRMFEKAADKCFTFKVASTDEIVAEPIAARGEIPMVRVTAPTVKVASGETVKTASELLTKRAFEGAAPQVAWDTMEKAILALEIYREKAAMSKEAVMQTEEKFCKIAQEMVAQEGYTYPEIFEALASTRPDHYQKIGLLLKVAAAHQGKKFVLPDLTKYAGAAVDPGEHDVISQISASGMPVEVINGAHKIVVSLDTLISQVTEADKANQNLWSADDTVKYLRNELRNFLATHTHV